MDFIIFFFNFLIDGISFLSSSFINGLQFLLSTFITIPSLVLELFYSLPNFFQVGLSGVFSLLLCVVFFKLLVLFKIL